MESLEAITSTLQTVVQSIVTRPEEIEFNIKDRTEDGKEITQINIKVARADIPTCIGTNGATAEALRRIAFLVARKHSYSKAIYLRVDAPPLPENHFYKG